MAVLYGRLALETFDYNQAGWNAIHTANMQKINDYLEKHGAQDAVKDKDIATPPGSPTAEDRYIIATGGTGAWSGKDKNLTEWNGVEWRFTAPLEGMFCYVKDETVFYEYNAAGNWVVSSYINGVVLTSQLIAATTGAGDASKPIKTDSGGALDDSFTLSALEVAGRITATSGTPVVTADATAITTLYWTPFRGNRVPLFDGTSVWKRYAFTEQSIKLTDTQTGSTTLDSAVVTALTDTSQLVRGMEVTGTGIPGGTTLISINSSTQVTLSANATATGTPVLTFKCPAGKNYDKFAVLVGTAVKTRFGNAWTSDTVRADALAIQNGMYVNNAAINASDSNTIAAKRGLYLGSVRTTAIAGQTESSFGGTHQAGGKRFVWNHYNRVLQSLGVVDTTDNWTYTTAAFRQVNGAAGNQVEILIGLAEDIVCAFAKANCGNNTAGNATVGVGIDSTTINSALLTGGSNSSLAGVQTLIAIYKNNIGIGYHKITWLEYSDIAGVTTWYGKAGLTYFQTGLIAEILG